MTNLQYRISWSTHNADGVAYRRYEHRETKRAVDALIRRLQAMQADDYCECNNGPVECIWCEGAGVPPKDIKVHSREVGDWESYPNEPQDSSS